MQDDLQRLEVLFAAFDVPAAETVAALLALYEQDQAGFWGRLNRGDVWGNVDSLAAKTLAANPGSEESLWDAHVREMRDILIRLGHALIERGGENPRVQDWVFAFSHWNMAD